MSLVRNIYLIKEYLFVSKEPFYQSSSTLEIHVQRSVAVFSMDYHDGTYLIENNQVESLVCNREDFIMIYA
jgi:hypothetical protein